MIDGVCYSNLLISVSLEFPKTGCDYYCIFFILTGEIYVCGCVRIGLNEW